MKSLKLKMVTGERRMGGCFKDGRMHMNQLSRNRGLQRAEYEEMVLGKWAWSSDGETHDHFVMFDEDNTCSFSDLSDHTIMAYEVHCRWRLAMKVLQLKMHVPE